MRSILIIKLIEQGATVLAYRAIERAVQLVGRENVYFLVFERNRFIVELLDLIPRDNVIAVRDAGMFTFARDTLAALFRIRKIGIDAAVDMEFFARASAILCWLSGARRRSGLHRFTAEGPYRGDLFTHRIQYNPYLHIAAFYYMIVEALTCDPRDIPLPKAAPPKMDWRPPEFAYSSSDQERVRQLVRAIAGRETDRIVLLNPNASDLLPLRRWPTQRFVELGRRLLEEHPDLTVLITGGPDERESADGVARDIGSERAHSAAGRTSLRDLLVLYTLSDVLVTNDSGPGHFAALTNISSVVLFGPETPQLFGPLGPNAQALTAGLACSPCVSAINHRFSPCTNNVCMQAIEVQQVLELVNAHLQRRTRPLSLTILPPALRPSRLPTGAR
jgi:ADP-heptose:LPS heptosyltransferase